MSHHAVVPARDRTRLTRLLVGAIALLALLASALPAEAARDEPEPHGTSRVWQQGREVVAGFMRSGPQGPYPYTREVDVFLVGPIDADNPQDDGSIRGPGCASNQAPCIHVPAHDDVMPPNVRGYQTRALANGHWVLASADAPAGAVLTRDVSRTDLPAHVGRPFGQITELAYAIRVGNRYQPLTSTHWVEHGLRLGWLELDDSVGSGGTAWIIDR